MAERAVLTLLIGGVRSGKSARAVALADTAAAEATAAGAAGRVLFVATAQAFDDEMAHRIAAHQAERPNAWETLEAPIALPEAIAGALDAAPVPPAAVVIDCLTLWVSNVLLALSDDADAEAELAARADALLAVWRSTATARERPDGPPTRWIVVTNEVGLGVVPATPLGRRYRDALGRVNQRVAAAADAVTLMVAGLELPLKPPR